MTSGSQSVTMNNNLNMSETTGSFRGSPQDPELGNQCHSTRLEYSRTHQIPHPSFQPIMHTSCCRQPQNAFTSQDIQPHAPYCPGISAQPRIVRVIQTCPSCRGLDDEEEGDDDESDDEETRNSENNEENNRGESYEGGMENSDDGDDDLEDGETLVGDDITLVNSDSEDDLREIRRRRRRIGDRPLGFGVENASNPRQNQQRRNLLEREDAVLGRHEGWERDAEEEAYEREMVERGREVIEANGGGVRYGGGYLDGLEEVGEDSSSDED